MTDTTERRIRIEATLNSNGQPKPSRTRVYIDDADVSNDTVAVHFHQDMASVSETTAEIRSVYGTAVGNGAPVVPASALADIKSALLGLEVQISELKDQK